MVDFIILHFVNAVIFLQISSETKYFSKQKKIYIGVYNPPDHDKDGMKIKLPTKPIFMKTKTAKFQDLSGV